MKKLQAEIKEFTEERGWSGNQDARNLAISISLESSELLEHFQWISGEEAVALNKQEIVDEAADVFIYLLQFADLLDIDLEEAVRGKMKKNAVKYPV